MQTSSKPVCKGDQVVGVQGVLSNITNRKLFEAQLKQIAATAERERLARDLHDSVTQALFTTSLIADTLPRVWERDPGEARKGLEQIRRLSNGALAEMRALLIELRPHALDEQGLDILLRQLADGIMALTHITITTTIMGDCKLPREVQMGLYRIAQEALNNIIKHSNASIAKLNLNCTEEGVILSVIDNGRGFDLDTSPLDHYGLKIMHERSLAIDANIRINSRLGQGTEVVVQWKEKGSLL
jgi:signal transduction histidine kinase